MRLRKIINICLILFFVAFSVLFCLQRLNSIPLISGKEQSLTVYEWWHIESFEGGSSNREAYLKRLALSYEKTNPADLFMIKSVSAEQLEECLQTSTPDLISFSEECAKIVLPYLQPLTSEYGVCDNYLQSAYFNGQLMAIPYIASGYCYFTKGEQSEILNLYTANNNQHNALSLVEDIEVNMGETLTSYECYIKFVNNKNIKLLGTARDLHRIKHLEEIGRLVATYEPISTFTDLIQYIGVLNPTSNILNFVDYIMSDTNQQALSKLGLFSTKHLTLYSEPIYSSFENALTTCYVPNIFS